ncbi:hypothetical protein C8R46DRAFT_362627 [Mycena filopes]|nr:hypothetical protein C8R46DRAFT_362627 [Mycena filopes]
MSARRGRRRRLHNRAAAPGSAPLFDEADWAVDSHDPDLRPGCLKAFIDPSRFPRASLVAVLQRFPRITHLRLLSMAGPEPILDDAFLALLSGPRASSSSSSSSEEDLEEPLCPRLTHLAVNAPCAGFSDAAVSDFVRAREGMGSPLEQVRVEFDRAVEVDIVGPLISEGRLELELQYTTPQWRFDPREGLFKGPEAY